MESIAGYFNELEQCHRKENKEKVGRFESLLTETAKCSLDYTLTVQNVEELLERVVDNVFSGNVAIIRGAEEDLLTNIDYLTSRFYFGRQPTAYWVYIWFVPNSMSKSLFGLTLFYWIRPNLKLK